MSDIDTSRIKGRRDLESESRLWVSPITENSSRQLKLNTEFSQVTKVTKLKFEDGYNLQSLRQKRCNNEFESATLLTIYDLLTK